MSDRLGEGFERPVMGAAGDAGVDTVNAAGDAGIFLPLETTAALVGGYRWIEQCLYEQLGAWAARHSSLPPGVRIHLDAQSARHAWHASLFGDRLPVRAGVDPDALVVAPEPLTSVVALLTGNTPIGGTLTDSTPTDPLPGDRTLVPALAGLYRVVLPRLVTTYSHHARVASPISDGPVIRALRLVLADESEDGRAGEQLVQQLVADQDEDSAVQAMEQHLESVFVEAGVGSGLIRWPV